MKLKIEKHPEFSKLTQYFKNIEDLAENMGLDVDDFLPDHHIRKTSGPSMNKMAVINGRQRAALFHMITSGETTLRAIVNENFTEK